MIDFYYWPTPNGWKIAIALEELGLAYKVLPVNIGRGEQFEPNFAKRPFLSLRNRKDPLCYRAVSTRGTPPLRRIKSAARRPGIHL